RSTHVQAPLRAPRWQSSRASSADGARRNHEPKSQLRARSRDAARRQRDHASEPQRRRRRGRAHAAPARVQRAISPRSRTGATRRALLVPGVHRSHESGLAVPRRDDLETILLIGSGPIIIGQACEFDYSGTQACRVLREEGFRVVLVNSNPATIMTDPEFADVTYVEP